MRRFLSFRDFDWALLAMVLVLCTVSVFEIYSATLHTKYAGYPHQADLLDRRRPGGHVHLRQDRLSLAAGLGSLGLWRLPAGAGGGQAGGAQSAAAHADGSASAPCTFSPPSGSS